MDHDAYPAFGCCPQQTERRVAQGEVTLARQELRLRTRNEADAMWRVPESFSLSLKRANVCMLPVENGCGNIWTMPIGPKGEKRLAETRTLAPSNRTLRGNLGQYQPLSISHQGQLPAVTISFNLALGVALGQATNVIQHAQDELQLPATVVPSFLGNAQAFQDSLSTVWILIVGALVVVYLILGILYESYIHPITIISTLPSAGVGALATLMLFHFDFSLIALIGIILLIGIVKKNGIMLVDFAMVAERDDHLSAHDAVRRAALLRFRPIMMTTMAAMLGGVPLMLGTGTGSELRQPHGYAIVGASS
jgi:hypothetical protein